MNKSLVLFSVALVISGCAIRQSVTPVGLFEGKQVCIVDNPKVRRGFLEAFKQALVDKGYEVRVLDTSSPLNSCSITATYTANWQWDVAVYMAYAAISVFHNGKTVGEAIYDTRGGDANMGKFIKAEEKVRELVKQLFPNRPGS
jgi:hypothetical protein